MMNGNKLLNCGIWFALRLTIAMVVFLSVVSPDTFRFPSFSMFFDMILSRYALIAWSVFALIDELDASMSPFISCVPSKRLPHK